MRMAIIWVLGSGLMRRYFYKFWRDVYAFIDSVIHGQVCIYA